MTTPSFAELDLIEPLQRALRAVEYVTPTPIQAQAIPHLLKGRDLLGVAQTGTGKTAAFTLPILQRLAAHAQPVAARKVRALILTPTRELAVQIAESVATYGRYLKLSHTVVMGGVGHVPQIKTLSRGIDVLIATPGRLMEMVADRHVHLDQVEVFVLDEADRMLDMGFIRDVRKVVAALPAARQSLLFSATMPKDIADLATSLLREPIRVEVTPVSTTVERIDQKVMFIDKGAKSRLLAAIMKDPDINRAIIFARTKHGANRLADVLQRTYQGGVEVIHGNKSQSARQRALDNFKIGTSKVLVATDIAARGIDVDGVSHVINFDLPNEPESYVHRIGRTARAGADGSALSFCDQTERSYLRDIEKLIRRRLFVVPTPELPVLPPAAEGDRQAARGDDRHAGRGRSQNGRAHNGRSQNGQSQNGRAHNGRPRNGQARNDRAQDDRAGQERPPRRGGKPQHRQGPRPGPGGGNGHGFTPHRSVNPQMAELHAVMRRREREDDARHNGHKPDREATGGESQDRQARHAVKPHRKGGGHKSGRSHQGERRFGKSRGRSGGPAGHGTSPGR